MAFDPLAFMKPSKAFTFEGLLSRDMFEKFAADDEVAYQQRTHGDELGDTEYKPESKKRLKLIADMIDDQPEQITQWLNDGYLVVIAIAPEVYEIILLDDDQNQTVGCRVRINDGPPLSKSALIRLAKRMEQKVAFWFQDQVAVNTTFASDGSGQINMALISERWILNHVSITLEVDTTDT